MSNVDFEWVEMCKSGDMVNNLIRYYNENYFADESEDVQLAAIGQILSYVVDEVASTSVASLFKCMEQHHHSEFSYVNRKVLALAYHLRYTPADNIAGYREWVNTKGE